MKSSSGVSSRTFPSRASATFCGKRGCSRIAASDSSARSRPLGCAAASCAGVCFDASGGTLAAALATEIRLAAPLAGSGALAGDLQTQIRLAALLNGTGSLTAQLEVILLDVIRLIKVSGSAPTIRQLSGRVADCVEVSGQPATVTALRGEG